jgi:hypothetical protein
MKTLEIKLLTKLNNINIALPVAAQIIPTVITQDIEVIMGLRRFRSAKKAQTITGQRVNLDL